MEPVPKWDIILAGESSVGKTSMILRYVNDTFSTKSKATVAVDLFLKRIKVFEQEVILNIWDSAGQEHYQSVVPMYFRRAHGCILVYDVTKITTFHSLSKWLQEFRHYHETAPVIIVGNKSDDPSCKVVGLSAIKSFAEWEKMEFMECSAKTGNNIEDVFDNLIRKVWAHKMAEITQEQKKEQNSETTDQPSLASMLFRNSNRDSIILTEAEPEEEEEEANNKQTSTPSKKKKKRKCC